MKNFLLILLSACCLTGCLEDECTETVTYIAYEPVILSGAQWRTNTFEATEGSTVCEPSGFYVYGNLLFVMDLNAGLHIIDNTDNAAPVPLKFVDIPGGSGIAVRNDILYINQYTDLLTFDLSDPENPEFLHRTEDVFPLYSNFGWSALASGEVIVDFIETDQTREISCNSSGSESSWFWDDRMFFATAEMSFQNVAANSAGTSAPDIVGVGGSLARFTINQGTLYAVDDNALRTFSLANPSEPEFTGTTELGWGIETIFPYKDMLFIGANNGMHIYGVEDPLRPEHYSTFEHVLSCDPVVVQNDLAYVTMWGGSDCGSLTDQLLVIDVSNPRKPEELQAVPMSNSHGLGVDGDHLFLCSGPEGLKVFDLTDEGLLGEQISVIAEFPAKDIITLPWQQRLIVLGWEQAGIRQYDYDATGQTTLAGELAICQ